MPPWASKMRLPAGVSGASWVMGRLDLRGLPSCSIDPPGCKDIDDALSAVELPNGNVQVGVHIADVTYFLSEGSDLDGEAQKRGTTVYLPDRRLDMLPSLLSTNLCSLRARSDRFAVSVLWELEPCGDTANPSFRILRDRTWVGESIIRSTHALTYDQAQALADGNDPNLSDGSMSDKDRRLTGITGPAWLSTASSNGISTQPEFKYCDPIEGGVCGAPVHPCEWKSLRPRVRLLT